MNYKLSDWASIAEIIAAIGVIVTLVFLILGIRENTEITKAAAFDRNMESLNVFRVDLARDPEFTRLWQSRQDPGVLSEDDQFRLIMLEGSLWGIYEKSYYARQYELIGESEWSRFETQMCFQLDSMSSQTWYEMRQVLTSQFISYAEGLCGKQ